MLEVIRKCSVSCFNAEAASSERTQCVKQRIVAGIQVWDSATHLLLVQIQATILPDIEGWQNASQDTINRFPKLFSLQPRYVGAWSLIMLVMLVMLMMARICTSINPSLVSWRGNWWWILPTLLTHWPPPTLNIEHWMFNVSQHS